MAKRKGKFVFVKSKGCKRQLEDVDPIEFKQEKKEHPWASAEQVAQIVRDHKRAEEQKKKLMIADVGGMSYAQVEAAVKKKDIAPRGIYTDSKGRVILEYRQQIAADELNPRETAIEKLETDLDNLRRQKWVAEHELRRTPTDEEFNKKAKELGEIEKKFDKTENRLINLIYGRQLGGAKERIEQVKADKEQLEKMTKDLTTGELLVLSQKRNLSPIENEVYRRELEKRK
jgi:hypothetical protein